MAEAEILNQERSPIGNHSYAAFGRDFRTRDGRHMMVAGVSAGQWKALLAACGIGDEIAALGNRLELDLARE